MFDEINQYPALKESQRIQAKDDARANVLARLGGEPQYEDYIRAVPSRFGRGAELFTLAFLLIVMVAAFVISAVHIFTVGKRTYLAGGNNETVAILIGVAFVLLAESAILAFSVAPTVWETRGNVNGLFAAGVMGSAFIATIGNIDATIFYSSGILDWLREWGMALLERPAVWAMATLPPFLTVLVGQVLKGRALSQSRARHEANVKHEAALSTWHRTLAAIESQPEWIPVYANTLWDAWCKGKRREMVEAITVAEKRLIVRREMDADSWFDSEEFPGGIQRNTRKASGMSRNGSGGLVDSVEGDLTQAEKVKVLLHERPDLLEMPRTEAMALLGVGGSTLYKALELHANNGYGSADSAHSNGE